MNKKKSRFLLNKLNKRIRRLENDISKNKKLNKNAERRANRKAEIQKNIFQQSYILFTIIL